SMADRPLPNNPGASGPQPPPGTESPASEPTAAFPPTPFVPAPSSGDQRTVVQQLSHFVERHAHKSAPLAHGYKLIQPIGEGTFGTVWLAEDRAGVKVAVKFFAHGTGREWQQLQDEVRSLAQLDATAGIIPLKEVRPD